jgi:hypothetical protein
MLCRASRTGPIPCQHDLIISAGEIFPLALFACIARLYQTHLTKEFMTSKEEDNKALVGRWFAEFCGKTCNISVVDELAAPDMTKGAMIRRENLRKLGQ